MYLIYGNSQIEIQQKINEIIQENNSNNVIKYSYIENELLDILEDASYISMFEEKKIIVISECLFLTSKDNKDITDLLRYINNPNESTIIIFTLNEEKLDERKKITKELKNKCEVYTYNIKENKNLVTIISDNFKRDNYKIDLESIKKIMELTENNKDTIINEIDKLKMYKINDKIITLNDVIEVIPKSLENNMFKLTEAINQKNKDKVFKIYKELINNRIEETVILNLLANQFRLYLSIKILLENNKNKYEINNILKEHPYRIDLGIKESSNYKKKDLMDYLKKLYEIDKSIKTGEITLNNSLEMFLIEMWGENDKNR